MSNKLKSKKKHLTTGEVVREKRLKEIKHDAVTEAFIQALAIPCLVYYDMGYGEEDMQEFVNGMLKMYSDCEDGLITLNQIKNRLWSEAGVKLING